MGQKCCSPTMRLDPKNISLLTLIYQQTQQSIKQLHYQLISAYLIKKGYIKTLCDYLSSHLSQINSTLLICRQKQYAARKETPDRQIIDCIITTEILRRIISLTKQMKEKYETRIYTSTLSNQKEYKQTVQSNSLKYNTLQQISNFKESTKAKSKHVSENDFHKSIKVKSIRNNQNIQYMQDEISHTALQICNQIIKQTLNYKNISVQNPLENQSKIGNTLFVILMNIQNIFKEVLDKEGGFIKVDYNMIKQILDNQIEILMMCRIQNQEVIPIQKKIRNSHSTVLHPNASNVFQRPNSNEMKGNQVQQVRKPQASNMNYLNQVFQQSRQQKNRMSKLCLGNYYQLIHKANIHMANANLYKDIVKMHMPRLLQFWKDLMIFSQLKHKNELNNIQEVSDEDEKQIHPQEAIKYGVQNAQYIQLIILQFFSSFFSFRQSQYIYRELMIMFDKLKFNKSRIQSIERLVFEALKNYELKDSVISKWLDYMLDYLGIVMSSNNESKGLNDSEQKDFIPLSIPVSPVNQEVNYLSNIDLGLNFENLKFEYINWTHQQNIIGCIKTIKRWIQTQVLDLQIVLNYKRTKLLISLLINLARGVEKIKITIIKFIQYLVIHDVRCFGYLIEATLSLLSSLKSNNGNLKEQSWASYFNRQQNFDDHILQQTLDSFVMKKSSLEPKKSFSIYKSKSYRSNELNIQIISLEKFIDELITVAGFPYLNKLIPIFSIQVEHNLPQLPKNIRRLSSPSIADQQKSLSPSKRKNSMSKIQDGFNIEDNNSSFNQSKKLRRSTSLRHQQLNNDKNNVNSLYIRSVFQQTISILFKSLKINSSQSNQKYRVRLASVVLTNSLENIAVLSSINKKQLTYSFYLASKINRFLSKIYKQLKYFSLDHENSITEMLTSRQRSFDQQNQNQNFVHLRLQKLENSHTIPLNGDQNQSISKLKYSNRNSISNVNETTNILGSLHFWLYPALCNYLATNNRFQLKKLQSINQGIEIGAQNKKKIKIQITIILKLYFKNMLYLSKQNLQLLRKSLYYHNSLLQKSMEQQINFRSSRSFIRENRLKKIQKFNLSKQKHNKSRNQEIQQDTQFQKQYFKIFILPIIQIFQLFLTAYDNYCQVSQTQQEQNKSKANNQDNYNKETELNNKGKLKKNKQKAQLSQLNNNNNKHKKQKQKTQNIKINNLISSIKVLKKQIKIFENSKNQFIKRNKKNEAYENNQTREQKYFNSLQNVERVEQIEVWDSNDLNSSKHLQQKLLHQLEDIIFDEQLIQIFFKFIDKITIYHQDLPKLTKSKSASDTTFNKATTKIIDNYLLNDQQVTTLVEEQGSNKIGRCFNFRKAKNKIMKAFGRNSTVQQQNTTQNSINNAPQQSLSPDKIKRVSALDYVQINQQNAFVALPQIIDIFLQDYQFNTYALRSSFILQSNQIKSKAGFSLGENDFNKKQSIMNSSKFSSSLEGSYGDILDEIQKH